MSNEYGDLTLIAAPSDAPACLITDAPDGLAVIGLTADQTPIPLRPSHAERTIHDILLAKRAGASPALLAKHLLEHQSDPTSNCRICQLTGRVMSAQGRRLTSEADRAIASRKRDSGTVQVRRFRPGLSGAQLSSMLKRGATPSEISRAADKQRLSKDSQAPSFVCTADSLI